MLVMPTQRTMMKNRFVIEQIRQTVSAKSSDRNLIFLLARTTVNHYISATKPAAPLFDMRNSAGLFWENLAGLVFVIPAKAGIQLLQNVRDTGTRTFHDVCRCNHDLTFRGFFNNILPNNTLHASRRICAPWRVTFFMALTHGVA
jgi:hypothetical protein